MMLSLGPASCYSERMPATSLSFAFHPRENCPNIPNATTTSYSNPLRRPRPSNQISKLCPFPHRKEKEEDRRRQVFLRKVRDAGDARKWEQRGDNILRKNYVSSQKRWEEQQVKAAPEMPIWPEDEEMELKAEVSRTEGADIIDEMLQHERKEFEALLGLFENESPLVEQETYKTDFGSEDEEFNRDCLEALWASETCRRPPGRSSDGMPESCLPMDMSID